MNRIYLICILLLLAFTGCKNPPDKTYEITKVELSRSGAWSDFGATISIDSSLAYNYWGDYKNIKQSFFTGKVSETFWDNLNSKLEHSGFKTAKQKLDGGCMDCEYYELIVHWHNKSKRFVRIDNTPQDSIMTFIKWVDSSYKKLKLRYIKDSIKFEVTPHGPPIPRVKSVKFPPPISFKN